MMGDITSALPMSNFGPMLGTVTGTSGDGTSSFEDDRPFAYEAVDTGGSGHRYRIKDCILTGATGFSLKCDDTEVDLPEDGTGYIWAKVDNTKGHGSEESAESALSVESGEELPTGSLRYSIRPLYVSNGGVIKTDLRYSIDVFLMT